MKCPLIVCREIVDQITYEPVPASCLKADCGFWDQNGDRCAVLQISRLLEAIGNTLSGIFLAANQPRHTIRCYYCGLTIVQTKAGGFETPEGWTRLEQADGYTVLICDQCSEQFEARR